MLKAKPVGRADRSHAEPTSRAYRADLDGLRAVSVLLVIAFHAGVTQLAGGYIGVDVFFVISGFLITGILLGEANETGSIKLRDFYARRIRRLLPLSALVLVVTVLAGIALVPSLDRAAMLGDARSAALYYSNWRFAGQATAYADVGPGDSLFVHYWSLSIEEQFYLLWPFIVLVTARFVSHRRTARLGPVLGVVVSVLALSSFALSIALTRLQGQSAYYGTHLRLGELATGAALAIAAGRLAGWQRLAAWRRLAGPAGVIGIVSIFVAAMAFDRSTPFPGSAVLLPVFGAALVIASGTGRSGAVGRLLGRPPLPAIGRLSYAWYLWHWPALGITSLLQGPGASPAAKAAGKVAAVAASFVLAAVSHHLLENPVRFSPRLKRSTRLSLALGATLTLVAVGTTFAPTPVAANRPVRSADGAGMSPAEARASIVTEMGDCHVSYHETRAKQGCVFGDPAGNRTIALIGDSVAQQWFPAFSRAARENHWRLLAWTKNACPMIDVVVHVSRLNRAYDECISWRSSVLDQLRTVQGVDLVIIGRSTYAAVNVLGPDGKRVQNLASTWRAAAGRTFTSLRRVADHVVVLRDTPLSPHDIPSCLSESPDAPQRCAFPQDSAVKDRTLTAAERSAAIDGVQIVDMTNHICPDDPCPVVTEAGMVIYRDRHHLTAVFSETLSPILARIVERTWTE